MKDGGPGAAGETVPPMIFKAPCAACGEERKFIEFKVEPCGPHSEAKKAEYGFRCLQCKTIVPALTDAAGRAHRWEQGRHVEA